MFSLEILEREYDMNSPEGKTEFYNEVARRLCNFEEEIERNNYIEAVAKAYHLGYENLRKLVVKMAVKSGLATLASRPKQTGNRENHREDGNLTSQKALITWLLDDEKIFPADQEIYYTERFYRRALYNGGGAVI